MLTLLDALSHRGELSSLQVYKGFQRFVDQLDDLALDTPHLRDTFQEFYAACIERGVIDAADQTVLTDAASRRGTESGEAAEACTSETAAQVRRVCKSNMCARARGGRVPLARR